MFILSDGRNYVMEGEVGKYYPTNSKEEAKRFTYKQARNLLVKNTSKKLSWVKNYHMINETNGKIEDSISQYSNQDVFCNDKEYEFDYSVIDSIKSEVNSIIGLAAWDSDQLNAFLAKLNQGLSFYESAISDIKHARMDKRPPAHIMTKIDKIMNELEEKRRDIKQTRLYVDVMLKALSEQWSIGKTRLELTKAKYVPYKGRTMYFEMVEDMLKDY